MAVDAEHGEQRVNIVGNVVLAPAADGLLNGLAVLGGGRFSLFLRDNLGPRSTEGEHDEALYVNPGNQGRRWLVAVRHESPPVTTWPAAELEERLLAGVGCLLPERDAVDRRLIEEVQARRVRTVDDPMAVGGWPELAAGQAETDRDRDGMPDVWEQHHGFDPGQAADGAADRDGDGYTNLEAFLNGTDPG